MKFTFKKHKAETGLRAVGYGRQSMDIKLDGKVVGTISAPNWQTPDGLWRILLMVKRKEAPTKNEPCTWEWIVLKFKAPTEEECRKFINDNMQQIIAMNLRSAESI